MNLLGWWRSRSNAARFDFYVRSTFYVSFLILPPLLITAMAEEVSTTALVLISAATVVHMILSVRLGHLGIEHHLGNTAFPQRLLVIFLAYTFAVLAVSELSYPHATPGKPDGPADGIARQIQTPTSQMRYHTPPISANVESHNSPHAASSRTGSR